MAYDDHLAKRVREYLAGLTGIEVEEKTMFGGLAFLVNDKMCVNVTEEGLMCRFDPELTEELSERKGFSPMIMKGSVLKGYCNVDPDGCKQKKDLAFWIDCCLDFNEKAKSSRKNNKKGR